MKREAVQPFIHTHSHTDFVQFLHPAPAEEIFKDPPPPCPLSVWEAQNGCLKYSGVALQKDIFCNFPLGYLFGTYWR